MLNRNDYKGAPFDIWGGGGGARVCVACKLYFFTSERKQAFFWRSTFDNFFLCFVEEIFCRMLSLLCRLPFGVFSGQHIFHQFRQPTFFSAQILKKLFFLLLWRQSIFFNFFYPPPPPQISNGASLKHRSYSVISKHLYNI